MSRSRKKIAFSGVTTASSDKPYKVELHRRRRRKARYLIQIQDYLAAEIEEPWDWWNSPKDGKILWEGHPFKTRALRK